MRRLISKEDLKLDRFLIVMTSYEDILQEQTGLMGQESRINYTSSSTSETNDKNFGCHASGAKETL